MCARSVRNDVTRTIMHLAGGRRVSRASHESGTYGRAAAVCCVDGAAGGCRPWSGCCVVCRAYRPRKSVVLHP